MWSTIKSLRDVKFNSTILNFVDKNLIMLKDNVALDYFYNLDIFKWHFI